MSKWRVEAEPEGENAGVNKGSVIIRLVSSSGAQEVSRVGFIRRNSQNPDVSFDAQLRAEVERASAAAATMNGLTGSGGLL